LLEPGKNNTWQATLTPHRSLTRQGFLTIMFLVIMVNVVIGAVFMSAGAWPVTGFAGLDVLLVWWAFRANFADAQRLERISITEHDVVLERMRKKKPTETSHFVRRWVRVELEEDRERELVGRLTLVSGGRRAVIGDFLSAEEKQALAQALRSALAIPRI
jgi:uncharacterized membrane protein